jgi:hypothetical protein
VSAGTTGSSTGTPVRARLGLRGERWLSRRDWQRSLRIAFDNGLSRRELRDLKDRLARVRTGGPQRLPQDSARPSPLLRVIAGGARPAPAVPPGDASPKEAA